MKPNVKFPFVFFFLILFILSPLAVAVAQPAITKAPFGKTKDGESVDIYTLRNTKGMEARITNYGGIVVSLTAPITAKSSELGMPSRLTRFLKTWSKAVPIKTPTIEPSPPRNEQPPSTAAAIP